jgi:hypothetical protein
LWFLVFAQQRPPLAPAGSHEQRPSPPRVQRGDDPGVPVVLPAVVHCPDQAGLAGSCPVHDRARSNTADPPTDCFRHAGPGSCGLSAVTPRGKPRGLRRWLQSCFAGSKPPPPPIAPEQHVVAGVEPVRSAGLWRVMRCASIVLTSAPWRSLAHRRFIFSFWRRLKCCTSAVPSTPRPARDFGFRNHGGPAHQRGAGGRRVHDRKSSMAQSSVRVE